MTRILFAVFSVAITFLSFTTALFAEASAKGYYVDLWASMPQDAKTGFAYGLRAALSLFAPSLNDSKQSLAEQMEALWGGSNCAQKYSSQETVTLIDAYIIANKERASNSTLALIAMEAIIDACRHSRK